MNDYILDNFLPEHHEEAERELTCYKYCLGVSAKHVELNNLDQAAVYLENAKRSLIDLDKLKKEHDQAWFINKRNEAERSQVELIAQLVKS